MKRRRNDRRENNREKQRTTARCKAGIEHSTFVERLDLAFYLGPFPGWGGVVGMHSRQHTLRSCDAAHKLITTLHYTLHIIPDTLLQFSITVRINIIEWISVPFLHHTCKFCCVYLPITISICFLNHFHHIVVTKFFT